MSRSKHPYADELNRIRPRLLVTVSFLLAGFCARTEPFDICPFARRCPAGDTYRLPTTFDYAYASTAPPVFEKQGEHYLYALQWAEERDIQEVRIRFASAYSSDKLVLQYWFQTWPYPPPAMPTIEDPVDDPWQGKWVTAKTASKTDGQECRFNFLPLDREENPKANHLPGLTYRRTLKIRFLSDDAPPRAQQVQVFTASTQKLETVRIELGVTGIGRASWEGKVEAYNGVIQSVRGWKTKPKDQVSSTGFHVRKGTGLLVDILGTLPAPSGSHDVTVISVRTGERSFSFALPDVEKGPIYVPDFDCYVTLGNDPQSFSPGLVKHGERIRQKLTKQPEQTYERAAREIPPLDPVERQGGRLYLPLAVDSSWQKFALEWGGNVFLDKRALKAKGAELKRLEWQGPRLSWRFGTGAVPSFRPASQDSKMRVLDDYLPITTTTWRTGEVEYEEEAFAAPLGGPLHWAGRDEQSPVVLLVRLTARNGSATSQESHVWVEISPAETLRFEHNELTSESGELLRAHVTHATDCAATLASIPAGSNASPALHLQSSLAPGGTDTIIFTLPFLPRLTSKERELLTLLDYEQERTRAIVYWRALIDRTIRFEVPEKRFENFSRAMLAHMHLSTSKDPKSGLFLVPAASYWYQVFANESCFQVLTLDALGDHRTAEGYLETFIQLQGSRPFRGTYTGDQRAVYHGAKVAPEYDYTASEYNLDHGTVLWAMAEHYFTTRNRKWFDHAAPSMIQAADWITEQRNQTRAMEGGRPVAEYGLLPAGHLEDNQDWGHWFAVNAYASAGMTRLAAALKETAHPEAARIAQDAEGYRRDLRQAVLRAAQDAPVTRLRDNTYIPYVPVRPHQRQRLFGPLRAAYYSRYPNPVLPTYRLSATREVLYGPLILLNLGIFGAQEPLANWVLDDWEDNLTLSSSLGLNVHGWVDDEYWFSRGGMVFQANLQNPVLAYLRRGEIPAALRNLYNDFVSCYYPDVNVFTEEYRQWRFPSGPFYKTPDEARFVSRLRDLLVREDGPDLWFACGTPRRWLTAGQAIRAKKMPTTFGPVDLELNAKETELTGQVKLPDRNAWANAWLVLRLPQPRSIGLVQIDGKAWRQVDRKRELIHLPKKPGATLQINVKFSENSLPPG